MLFDWNPPYYIFIWEIVMLELFGLSWLTKGGVIFKDKYNCKHCYFEGDYNACSICVDYNMFDLDETFTHLK